MRDLIPNRLILLGSGPEEGQFLMKAYNDGDVRDGRPVYVVEDGKVDAFFRIEAKLDAILERKSPPGNCVEVPLPLKDDGSGFDPDAFGVDDKYLPPGLTLSESVERLRLLDKVSSKTEFMTQEEQDRLSELSERAFGVKKPRD